MLPLNVLYYGQASPLPERIPLRAGPLTLLYEQGDLRYIKLGKQEILRRVYVAVRNSNWDTVLPVLSNIKLDIGSDSFRISYDVTNKQSDLDFFWQGQISGNPQGVITFSLDGEARVTFLRNRIGFCILHPMRLAGTVTRIEHVDGSAEEIAFPVQIAPQQVIDGIIHPVHPFSEIRALTHQVQPGLWAEVRLTGETFEMEDQRNWIDASYKTYGTPLRLPFPAEVQKGTKISQSFTLTLKDNGRALKDEGGRRQHEEKSGTFFILHPSREAVILPRVGLGVASHGQPLSEKELARLKVLTPAHLRVDLKLWEPDSAEALRRAWAEASALDCSLEVAIHLSDKAESELAGLRALLVKVRPFVWAWLIFHQKEKSTGQYWISLAREHLTGYDPTAKLGSGTNIFFTELNRGRPPLQALDLVCYSINPQVHAFDNASLAETLEAHAPTVVSARHFSGDLPLAVTPVTLKMRFNPNAIGPEPEPKPGELPEQVDGRQMSLFGAGWTLGSLKYLAESQAASVTYYETSGWRGVMETEAGSPLPEKFVAIPGAVFPLYHVLADVSEFAGGEIIRSQSSNTLTVDGLALQKDGRTRLILANLTDRPQQISVQNLSGSVWVGHLNETNVETAMQAPEAFRSTPGELLPTSAGALELNLLPYALVRIDSVSE